MEKRKYMNFKVSEMQSAFVESGQSRVVALALLEELAHRSTLSAKALQKRLNKFLKGGPTATQSSLPYVSQSAEQEVTQKPIPGLSRAGFGINFPVSDYFKGHIIDARTIQNNGKWWTAVLVIEDPKTGKRFIKMYKWESKEGVWKVHSNFSLNSQKLIFGAIEAVSELKGLVE